MGGQLMGCLPRRGDKELGSQDPPPHPDWPSSPSSGWPLGWAYLWRARLCAVAVQQLLLSEAKNSLFSAHAQLRPSQSQRGLVAGGDRSGQDLSMGERAQPRGGRRPPGETGDLGPVCWL